MDGVVGKAGSQVDIKREWVCDMSSDEEDLIIRMHKLLGDRWSLIAGRIPGRTAEEIEKYWKFKRHSCENIPRPYHPRVSRIIRRFIMPSRSISERYLKGGLADEFIPKSRT